MKLMNFRRFDPKQAQSGKAGLKAGNREEGPVWKAFAEHPHLLNETADAIRAGILLSDTDGQAGDEADHAGFSEAQEGRLLSRMHFYRERNQKIVEKKKSQALKAFGRLACEACKFDFAAFYGERGAGFIECHHTRPLHTLATSTATKLEDLALVCANCHRMLHADRAWIDIEELKAILAAGK